MRLALISVLFLFMFSCTPEKRIARILKNNPHLIKSDTIIRKDTVVSESVKKDTTFKYYTRDSVIVREGKLVMKYYYNSHDSTVYLRGECLPDTIIREVPIQINSVSVKESNSIIQNLKNSIYNPILWLLIVLIVLLYFKK